MVSALCRLVAAADQGRAVEALGTCSDSERVRTAVLILAAQTGHGADAVEDLAMAAVVDWRDVLMWAEYSPHRVDYAAELERLQLPRTRDQ